MKNQAGQTTADACRPLNVNEFNHYPKLNLINVAGNISNFTAFSVFSHYKKILMYETDND